MELSNIALVGLPVIVFASVFDWSEDEVEPINRAEEFVEIVKGVIPTVDEQGNHMSISAEGNTIILKMQFANNEIFDTFSQTQIQRTMKNAFCVGHRRSTNKGMRFNSYFKEGVKVRLDYVNNYGSLVKGNAISKC